MKTTGQRLRRLFQRRAWAAWFATSLWPIPMGAAVVAFGLARGLAWVDRTIPQDRETWYLFGGSPSSARELLSTIASALMSLTGLVFSITILVLQLASSQFSPRVLRTFLEDRLTRFSMGVFIGSFVYAMALLPEVRGSNGEPGSQFVPALAVFVAFLLVLASVGVFVRYIHHMAHSIRAVHIVRRVAEDSREGLDALYPEDVANEPEPSVRLPTGTPHQVIASEGPPGVVAVVADEPLLQLAMKKDVTLVLVPQVGDFVPRGAPLFRVWGASDLSGSELREHVVLSPERTPQQDPAFGLRQLVDVAERALSPGVNDPTTAVQTLDQIHDLLRALAPRHIPSPARVDDGGALRLVLPRPDWDAYVRLGFDEIRQYGGSSIQVVRKLRSMLDDLLTVAPPRRHPVLREQLTLLDAAVTRNFPSPAERAIARRPGSQGEGQP